MNETFLDNKKSEISNLIKNNASGKIMKIVKEVFRKVGDSDEFAEFVGQIFLIDPDFFFDKFAPIYYKNILKLLTSKQLFEMEEYILEKFSLYQNENILVSFSGEIAKGDGKMKGRIYLTNYRIIVQGINKSMVRMTSVTKSIVDKVLLYPITKTKHKRFIKKLRVIMDQITITELPCFGYQYPTFGLQKIRVNNYGNKIVYTVRLETESPSGAETSQKYVFTIFVNRNPGENVNSYDIRANEILSLLNDTIVETSKQFE